LLSVSGGRTWLGGLDMASTSQSKDGRATSRRQVLLGPSGAVAVALGQPRRSGAQGFFMAGPVTMPMSGIKYEEVACNEDRGEMLKGTKATAGLVPRCVLATATVTNPTDKPLKKAGVFGRINDKEADTSVLANAMDGATDVGQFTLIETIPPGTTEVQFRFVAALPKQGLKLPLPPLEFKSLKAIWYPGGNRFEPLGECDLNPVAPGCDPDVM